MITASLAEAEDPKKKLVTESTQLFWITPTYKKEREYAVYEVEDVETFSQLKSIFSNRNVKNDVFEILVDSEGSPFNGFFLFKNNDSYTVAFEVEAFTSDLKSVRDSRVLVDDQNTMIIRVKGDLGESMVVDQEYRSFIPLIISKKKNFRNLVKIYKITNSDLNR